MCFAGLLLSPFDDKSTTAVIHSDSRAEVSESDCNYDWATFIIAYASGRWDPHRTPNPPRSYLLTPAHLLYTISDPSAVTSHASPGSCSTDDTSLDVRDVDSEERESCADAPTHSQGPVTPPPPHLANKSEPDHPECHSPVNTNTVYSPGDSPPSKFRPKAPPILSHRLRASFTDLRSTHPNNLASDTNHAAHSSNPEVTAVAAAMRWAAARVNLSPLSLPSPEHELTDPMRGVTATIPGSHPATSSSQEIMTPGGSRRPRLTSFWQGTQDVDQAGHLATIEASPPVTPVEQTAKSDLGVSKFDAILPNMPIPASAPALNAASKPGGDYFGDVEPIEDPSCLGCSQVDIPAAPEAGTVSVPALPRRVCLTRQTSSPLPASSSRETRYPGGRVASENIASVKAAKEEQMFAELGYLAPPNPPDELERRRALYK
jgi:hypothetical protein